MYSQYIPHFPTLWLTKDERSLLYKYFILNPSLCCISSIVSSHLQILYIVQKSADVGKGHVLGDSPAAPRAAALLPGRDCKWGSLLPGRQSTGWGAWSSRRTGCGCADRRPRGQVQGGRREWEQKVRLWLGKQKTPVLLLSALDLGENERVKMPLC